MPVSNRELQALEIIQRYGGQIGDSVVAQAMHLGPEYARTICRSLGQADYIDMTLQGWCKITDKGIEELLNRGGSITLADPSGLSPSGQSLEPAYEEAEVPQETRGSQALWSRSDVSYQEPPRPAAAPASPPGNMIDLKCAYCYGRSTDPFGIPGPASKCAVCGGKGYNRVVSPYATCTACGGTGKMPGRRMTCTTCKGKGVTAARPKTGAGRHFGALTIAAASTAPGTITSAAPVLSSPVSVADRIATHITNFPGVKAPHVEALFGLSKGEAKSRLQELVQAHKICLKDDGLYYPA